MFSRVEVRARFIPVCSGNALRQVGLCWVVAVYPRVLGERSHEIQAAKVNTGLSPCARGTRTLRTERRSETRFIPVCSGNAATAAPDGMYRTVYPRVLGERLSPLPVIIHSGGLSPCARGTLKAVL